MIQVLYQTRLILASICIIMPLYDEIEFEDMTYDPETMIYSYPCPCGDRFKVTLEDLWDGEDVADCQSCTLYIEVIYDEEDLHPLPDDDGDDDEDDGNNNQIIDEQFKEQTGSNIETGHKADDSTIDKVLQKLSISTQ